MFSAGVSIVSGFVGRWTCPHAHGTGVSKEKIPHFVENIQLSGAQSLPLVVPAEIDIGEAKHGLFLIPRD